MADSSFQSEGQESGTDDTSSIPGVSSGNAEASTAASANASDTNDDSADQILPYLSSMDQVVAAIPDISNQITDKIVSHLSKSTFNDDNELELNVDDLRLEIISSLQKFFGERMQTPELDLTPPVYDVSVR